MYINNHLCPYEMRKEENKCGRIFRPWDNKVAKIAFKDTAQDSTVSTTTKDDDALTDKVEETPNVLRKSCNNQEENRKTQIERTSILSTSRSVSPQNSEVSLARSSPSSPIGCCASTISKSQKSVLNKCSKSHPVSDLLRETLSQYPKPLERPLENPEIFVQTPIDYLQDPYNQLNTDLLQTNLAQHLGLPPNDPLLMESLAQGYALEEYARVLSQEQQAKLMAAKKQRPKKYKCPHCDVGFSNNGQLKGHIRIHTGERPFKCDEKDCGKTFTRNEELTRHKRIHSGLRPFPCSHCGKRFGRKDHLKKHSRTHFQPRGLYAVPVVLPFEAWASGQTNGYPFFPMMY